MVIQNMKVAPLTKKDQAARKDSICFCHTTQPILTFLRCWGILPITTRHENGSCVFERSWAWSIHTGIVCSFYVYQLVMHVDIEDILATKSLIIFLNHITNAVYALYVLIMLLLAAIKLPQYTRMLNASALVFKHGLFCQTAKRVALLTQYGIVTAFLCLAFSQAAIYYWLFNSETCGSVSDFFFRFSQTTSLLFYAGFFSLIAVVIGGFACFEKLLTSSLNYVPVHPMAGIDETNNQRDFFGVIHYQLCRSEHKALVEFTSMNAAEVVEFLRICHEDMCSCIYSWNCTMDPTFLIYIVLELAIIIIHSYSVVAHLVYTFKHPLAATIHTLNCVFVFIHVYGLYLFLKNAQRMKNMVRGLTDFLLEYSTRISSLDEHQQVRLFIEKLNNHRPFTASGVFTIDLEIAGPISANILTYVLVALQFEIPEE